MFRTDVGKLAHCIVCRNIPVIGCFFFSFFFLSLGCAISRHGGDARLVFSVTVHWKVQQHMGFLSPPRADSNRQIPRRIQCQRRVISIGVALWLMSFQCVFQWQCSYTALIAIPRLRQRGRWQRQRSTAANRMLKTAHASTSPAQVTLPTHRQRHRRVLPQEDAHGRTHNDSDKWWTSQIRTKMQKKEKHREDLSKAEAERVRSWCGIASYNRWK